MPLCEHRLFSPFYLLSSGRLSTSSSSASASALIGDFEDSLRRRLGSLLPPRLESNNTAVLLAYLSRAVGVLSSTHAEAARLLGAGPAGTAAGAGHDALLAYLESSAGILDLCNAASAEVDRARHRRLLLVYAVQLLAGDGRGEASAAWRTEKARKAMEEWVAGSEGEEVQRYKHKAVVPAVPSPRKGEEYLGGRRRLSPSGRAVLAVEAVFALVRAILLTFLFPATSTTVHTAAVDLGIPGVPDELGWAGVYRELQAAISACSSDRGTPPRVLEIDAVISRTEELKGAGNRFGPSSGGDAAAELKNVVEDLNRGLEGLAEAVTALFRSALRARDAALENLRAGRRKGGPQLR